MTEPAYCKWRSLPLLNTPARQNEYASCSLGFQLRSVIPEFKAPFVREVRVRGNEVWPIQARSSIPPLCDQGQKRHGPRFVIYVRPSRLHRQRFQAAGKAIEGFAKRISSEHLKSEPEMFTMPKARGIDAAFHEISQRFFSRALNVLHSPFPPACDYRPR